MLSAKFSNVFGRARSTFKYLRLQPFDVSTEEGRSAERHRRIALSAATSMLGKVLSMLVPLVTIPLTLSYLGKERYGIWMTLSSITSSLRFADLGIGLGLLNLISECNGKDDRKQARVYVSSAFYMLLGIACVLALAYWVGAPHLNWTHYFHSSTPEASRDVPAVMAIFVMCFLLNMPLDVVDRVYLGYQESFRTSMAQLIASIFYLAGVIFVVKTDLGLAGLVLVSSGLPILTLLINGSWLFFFHKPWLRPQVSLIETGSMKRILQIGSMFLVLQICVAISYSSDNLVISGVKGAIAVADYAVPSKMFGIIASLIPMLVTPLWPALIEAANRGDVKWVKRTLYRAFGFVLALTVPSGLLLVFAAQPIIALWTHNQLHPTYLVLVALAVWTTIGGIGNVAAVFMNSMNIVRFQVIAAVLASVLNLTLSIWLTRRFGAAGVVIGSTIAMLFLLIPVFLYVIPQAFRKLENKDSSEVSWLFQ